LVSDAGTSLLATLGRFISPVFAPLGFNDWRAATALVTGLTAKEAVVSTLSVLTGTLDKQALAAALGTIFTVPAAAAFLTFTLLYTPCVAAMAAARRELGGTLPMLEMVGAQCTVAWLVAFVVYRVALIVL
jgi:ferrous iron transport protein B